MEGRAENAERGAGSGERGAAIFLPRTSLRGSCLMLAECGSGLRQTGFPTRIGPMSTVELAVQKVKKLSAGEARDLLGWLEQHTNGGNASRRRIRAWWRKGTPRQRLKNLKAWEDSVRLTTDWEPPKMPDDLVKSFEFRP